MERNRNGELCPILNSASLMYGGAWKKWRRAHVANIQGELVIRGEFDW